MFYVYVLLSENKDTYVGFTSDLKRRIKEHNSGRNISTKTHKWNLVYYEAYLDEEDARLRERKLKQRGKTKQVLFHRIKNCIQNI